MTEITEVKKSVETKLTTSITIIKENRAKEKEKHAAESKSLHDKVEALQKQVNANTQTTEKVKADQESMQDVIEKLVVAVEEGDAQHAKTTEEIDSLNEMIEGMVDEMEAKKGQFPTKEDIAKLEGAITKVNAKVIGMSEKIDKETEQREAAVDALSERVTANENHLDELEEEMAGMQEA